MIYVFALSLFVFMYATYQYFIGCHLSNDSVVTPKVDEATAKYFKELETFEWDFHEKYKFERNKRKYLSDCQAELFAAASTETQKLVLDAFRKYHWRNGKKPVLLDFAVKPVVAL